MALRATLPLLPALVRRVTDWPVEAQLQARRNALVASTALARRRAERLEVEEVLAALASGHEERRAAHG